MALADYRLCDLCSAKAFYDSNLGYDFEEHPDTGLFNTGAWKVLCRDCAKTHEVKVEPKATATINDRAAKLFDALERDISDRRGLKQEWRAIAPDVKAEIRAEWLRLITSILPAKGGG